MGNNIKLTKGEGYLNDFSKLTQSQEKIMEHNPTSASFHRYQKALIEFFDQIYRDGYLDIIKDKNLFLK